MNLRAHRSVLGISQSRLARLSGVSRFKICTFELGDALLTTEEQDSIRSALETEARRLRDINVEIDFEPLNSGLKHPDREIRRGVR